MSFCLPRTDALLFLLPWPWQMLCSFWLLTTLLISPLTAHLHLVVLEASHCRPKCPPRAVVLSAAAAPFRARPVPDLKRVGASLSERTTGGRSLPIRSPQDEPGRTATPCRYGSDGVLSCGGVDRSWDSYHCTRAPAKRAGRVAAFDSGKSTRPDILPGAEILPGRIFRAGCLENVPPWHQPPHFPGQPTRLPNWALSGLFQWEVGGDR